MKKKNFIKVIFILLIVLSLLVLLISKLNNARNSNIRSSKENLKYIYSNEIDEETVSPNMIHVILALYEGDVNPKSITKSTYYFVNTVIPYYKKECPNIDKAKRYFKKNKEDIYIDTGIKDEDTFLDLINKIKEIEDSNIESSRFDKDYIIKNNDSLESILYIKYKNGEEISFKVIISNYKLENEPSITYTID